MRIRKKKHLKERLFAVQDYVIVPKRDVPNVLEAVKLKDYFDFENLFSNSNPVELEIGCGKGGFIIEKARRNPDKNFIAVELLENIIVMAAEHAKELGLKNLIFVNSGAEYLPRYIKEGSIDNLYLNFSPPYPQDGYEGRRLTNPRLIENYYKYLKDDGAIYQKTDDRPFFDYSFKKFVEGGFDVLEISDDIEKGLVDNVCTEYESKFRKEGIKINALIARKRR